MLAPITLRMLISFCFCCVVNAVRPSKPKAGNHDGQYGKSGKDFPPFLIGCILRIKIFIQKFVFKRQLREIFFPDIFRLVQWIVLISPGFSFT